MNHALCGAGFVQLARVRKALGLEETGQIMGRLAREGEGLASAVWQRPLPLPRTFTQSRRPVSFAHPAEEEFANVLSYYRIRWLYEPTSFVLVRGSDGNPLESFTPDFYLPDHQLFIELTTMKQALVTRKNRKLRRLRELYPSVQIKLFYRRDVERLLRPYATPRNAPPAMTLGPTLACERTVQQRIASLVDEISDWNSVPDKASNRPPLHVIAAAPGASLFQRQLSNALCQSGIAHDADRMRVSRYRTLSGNRLVRIATSPRRDVRGHDVLIVTDQVNTGLSLAYLVGWLKRHGAGRIEICALVRKPGAAVIDTPVRFVAFDVPDVPVAGFGLDSVPRFRDLPYIAALLPVVQELAPPLD